MAALTTAGAIRDHRADAARGDRVDSRGTSETGAVSVFRARFGVASSLNAAVLADRRILVGSIGLHPAAYGTHSLRRTKATLIYRRTRDLRAVQLSLGHTKLESTVRYLGIEVDDALESPSKPRCNSMGPVSDRRPRRSRTGQKRKSASDLGLLRAAGREPNLLA